MPAARTPRRPALLTVIVERDGTFATLDGDAEDGMIAAANWRTTFRVGPCGQPAVLWSRHKPRLRGRSDLCAAAVPERRPQMANSPGDTGGSIASRSALIGISSGHSLRQFGQHGGGGPRRPVAGGAPGTEFFDRTRTTTAAAGGLSSPQPLTSLPGGFGGPV